MKSELYYRKNSQKTELRIRNYDFDGTNLLNFRQKFKKKSNENNNALQHRIKLIAGFSPIYESPNELS